MNSLLSLTGGFNPRLREAGDVGTMPKKKISYRFNPRLREAGDMNTERKSNR